MRMRATLGVITGALTLSALAVPAAQADVAYGDIKISNVVVNGGKPVVGATGKKTVTVTFTATDNSGIGVGEAILYHGPTTKDAFEAGAFAEGGKTTCTAVSSTTSICKGRHTIDVGKALKNGNAGTWKVWAIAAAEDGDAVLKDNAKTFKVQSATKR